MKLTGVKVGGFLAKPDPAVLFILLHGPDEGLVRERARALMARAGVDGSDPFSFAELTSDAIKTDPARLLDEALTRSLLGGRRVLRLRPAEDSAAGAVDALLNATPLPDALVIAEAGELSARSKLRTLAEAHPQAAAIGCYPAEGRELEGVIDTLIHAAGATIAKEARAMLVQRLAADRMAQRNEIEKLVTYAGIRGEKGEDSQTGNTARILITQADVDAVIGDGGESDLERAAVAAADGDVPEISRALGRLFAEGESAVGILRAAQRHFLKLYTLALKCEAGATAEGAVKSLRPPVFFKDEPVLIRQVKKWPRGKVRRALSLLVEAEAAAKRTGMPDQALTGQVLIRLGAR